MNPADELTDKQLDDVSGGGFPANLVDPANGAILGNCMMALLEDAIEQRNDAQKMVNAANSQDGRRRK